MYAQYIAPAAPPFAERRLEEKAQSRFDLLQYSAGPVFCHDDLQQGNVLASKLALRTWFAVVIALPGVPLIA